MSNAKAWRYAPLWYSGVPSAKRVLDEEIAVLEKMGVTMVTNTKIGEDISFETIRRDFDAVCVGIGAWVSTGVRCKGEDAKGVIGGIDFLRKVVRNEPIDLGKKVAIVGGGNHRYGRLPYSSTSGR